MTAGTMPKKILAYALFFSAGGAVAATIQGGSAEVIAGSAILLAVTGAAISARWSHAESSRERRLQPRPDIGSVAPSPRAIRLRYLALGSVLALPIVMGATSILIGAAEPAYYFAAGLGLGLTNSVTLYLVGTPAGNW